MGLAKTKKDRFGRTLVPSRRGKNAYVVVETRAEKLPDARAVALGARTADEDSASSTSGSSGSRSRSSSK